MSFAEIIAWVVSLIQSVIDFIVAALEWLIGVLNVVFGFIWNTLVAFAQFLLGIFQKIGSFFVNLWTNYIKPAINGLIHLYQRIRARLQVIFGPIIKRLQWLRAKYYQYVYPWVKLAQNIISTIRVILAAFRILGAKWAAKLDRDLQRIQGWITAFNQSVVGTLNQVTTWLQFAIDPAGILRKGFFSNTLFTSLSSVSRSVGFGKDRYLTASEAENTQQDRAMLGGGAAILTRNANGTVNYSDASKRINDGYDAAWQSYGGTTGLH